MSSESNKRKLEDISIDSQPPVKRRRKDIDESQKEYNMIPVTFQNESREYKKEDVVNIEFCRVKLERWSPDIDQDDDDDDDDDVDNNDNKENDKNHNIKKRQYFIDFTLFPCITPKIFISIIHLQQIFKSSNNNEDNVQIMYKAATSLLADNIQINDLPQLLEACKILLVTKIFKKEIFKYYFNQHPPISFEACNRIKNIHTNHEFFTSIISTQIGLYNIMNEWSAQKKVYDRYNKIGSINCPFLGNVTPNAQHAMKYAMQQISHESHREHTRELLHDKKYNVNDQYDDNYVQPEFDRDYDDYEEREQHQEWLDQQIEKMRDELSKDIDYGLCAAFDDIVNYGGNIEPFLTLFFGFIDDTFLDDRWIPTNSTNPEVLMGFAHNSNTGILLDRANFCFYGIAYILHRIFILYLQKNTVIINYLNNNGQFRGYRRCRKTIIEIFDLFNKILHHEVTEKNDFWNSDKMQMLIKQRINDCIKYKQEWSACSGLNHIYQIIRFPDDIVVPISKCLSDPEWLVNNFALKCNNNDCIKVMHRILEICMDRMDKTKVSESLNKTFEKYLGVRINPQ